MLSTIFFLIGLIPSHHSFFFSTAGCGGCNTCNCPPLVACAPKITPPPTCATPAPCTPMPCASSCSYPAPSTVYQPGWIPAIPSPSYPAPPSYQISGSYIPPPPPPPPPPQLPVPPSPLYYQESRIDTTKAYVNVNSNYATKSSSSMPIPPPLPTQSYTRTLEVVTTIGGTTPTYPEKYEPSPYERPYQDNQEDIEPPAPPPTDEELSKLPITYDYKTSQIVEPTSETDNVSYLSPSYGEPDQTESPIPISVNPYSPPTNDNILKRHMILKRMKTSTDVPRTNATCNSIKLANVLTKSILDDVASSKRMIQHATKIAFDGAKFDVFCANGEFSYSIHSRKYCEITKDEITCFAFR